jgi:hypothetical protein
MRQLLVLVVLALGCGGRNNNPDAGQNPDAGSGRDVLSTDEAVLADRGGDSSNATQQLSVVANSLFDFDPTIDAARTAAENATAIENNVRANLGYDADGGVPLDGGTPCGSVSLSGTTVTVAFGPPPGCTLRNGAKLSGSVSVGVARTGSTISLSLTFTQLVSNGVPLSGSVTFATTSGSSFSVTGSLTSGTNTWTFTNLTITGAAGTTTINGVINLMGDAVATTITFGTLSWRLGDCYPNSGTVTTKKGLLTTVFTFDTNTPTTGIVKVTVGRITTNWPLPIYGSCGARDGGP